MLFKPEKAKMIKPENALTGRSIPIKLSGIHTVSKHTILPPSLIT